MAAKTKIIMFFVILLGSFLPLQAQSLRRVVAAPFQSGSPAVVRFEWEMAAPIPAKWRMGIILPAEFDRSQLLLAASVRLNGGFLVANSGDTLWVERSGLGNRMAEDGMVDLSIASIGLPVDLQKQYLFHFIQQDSTRQTTFSGTMTISREE